MSIAALSTARKWKAYFTRKIPSVSRCGVVVTAVHRFTGSDEEAPGGDKAARGDYDHLGQLPQLCI